MADLKTMKGLSADDRNTIAQAEALLGADSAEQGVVRTMFAGGVRSDLLFPYPDRAIEHPDEVAECDQLLAELEDYLKNEHPSIEIDQEQHMPEWVLQRLFKMGVLGMTIPKDKGGLGMGITSYNRVLEMIGKYCGSTAVIVSAHQSIGCKAVMLFGTEEQKNEWLPRLARDWLSAFCLSEPNVGCDAGGQETRIEVSEDGEHFILNGEKKWATSGAISGLFTVMAKQNINGKDKVTAVVCQPNMDGIDIYSPNRAKCGIRGTWQARIIFKDVKVPRKNLLHEEGKGLNVALTCLNYGRCTLSAGMLGGAKRAKDQGIKWAQTRYQFGKALADFEQVQEKIARMTAYCYAMDAVLYMTTGFLDRHDDDIRVETAICKVFCSEMGWRSVNDAVQIMGGESYMTENEIERIFRDSRINTIVEGANEVMQQFIFGWGGKALAEHMLGLKMAAESFKFSPAIVKAGVPIFTEVILGIRRRPPNIEGLHQSLVEQGKRVGKWISEFTYRYKITGKKYDTKMVQAQCAQARIADAAIFLHAWLCTLSKLDADIRAGHGGIEFERDKQAALHFFDMAEIEIKNAFAALEVNSDESMKIAAAAALKVSDSLPASDFIIAEKTPTDLRGKGRVPDQTHIKQFHGITGQYVSGGTGREGMSKIDED
jgi:alkylation response protein AidB-like acyl-CoA dehydrogenase